MLTEADAIIRVVETYAAPVYHPGDVLFLSQKATAITQGRTIRVKELNPGFWPSFYPGLRYCLKNLNCSSRLASLGPMPGMNFKSAALTPPVARMAKP